MKLCDLCPELFSTETHLHLMAHDLLKEKSQAFFDKMQDRLKSDSIMEQSSRQTLQLSSVVQQCDDSEGGP
jgi:hypothetical protein